MKQRTLLICLTVTGLLCHPTLSAQPPGYTYGKQITIQASQVGGSLSDFPVLISLTDNDLRNIPNGGHVENANGCDIFSYLEDCATPLSHQIEKYVATTGQHVAWVKLPTLDNAANTEIVLLYGNGSANADPSTNSTWGNYGAIWHFSNNSFADATANGNNGANSGTTNATGKIGDCRSFSAAANITVPYQSSLNVTASFTFSAWINPTVLNGASGHGIFSKNAFAADYIFGLDWPQGANDALNCWLYNSGFTLYHAGTVPTGQWSHVAATFDGSSVRLYRNGILIGTTSRATNVAANATGLVIGQGNTGSSSNFSGLIDEPRISPISQDDAWLLTEFNNQNNPAAFYAVSAEMTAAAACGVSLPVELLDFQAKAVSPSGVGGSALLTWRTASEQNNQGFYIEKSPDGGQFESIGFAAGGGFRSEERNYFFEDKNFFADAYYRLRQVDFDGQEELFKLIFLEKEKGAAFQLYPNPAADWLTIAGLPDEAAATLTLTDARGEVIWVKQVDSLTGGPLDVSDLQPGLYFLDFRWESRREVMRLVKR